MSSLLRNTVLNLLGQGLLVVLSFLSVKFVMSELGADALGIVYFTTSLTIVLTSVLELGISNTTIREVAAHYRKDPDYVLGLLRTGNSVYWMAFGLLSLLIFFAAPWMVNEWIQLTTLSSEETVSAVRWLGISSLLTLPKSLYGSVFRGLERMEFNNGIDVVVTGVQQGGILLALSLGGGLMAVVFWISLLNVLGLVTYAFFVSRLASWRALLLGYHREAVIRNRHFAAKTALLTLVTMVLTQADKLVVTTFLPLALLGYYGVAYSTAHKGMLVTLAVSQAAFPSFSEYCSSEPLETWRARYEWIQSLIVMVAVPTFAVFPFAALPLFGFLLNADAAASLVVPTTLLALSFFMNATLTVPYVVTLALGKPELPLKNNLWALLVTVPIMVALVHQFSLVGAAAGWVAYHVFAYLYLVPRFQIECLQAPVGKFYMQVGFPAALAGGIYGAAWFSVFAFGSPSLFALASSYGLATIAFVIIAWRRLDPGLRGWLRVALSQQVDRIWSRGEPAPAHSGSKG